MIPHTHDRITMGDRDLKGLETSILCPKSRHIKKRLQFFQINQIFINRKPNVTTIHKKAQKKVQSREISENLPHFGDYSQSIKRDFVTKITVTIGNQS
jgi:hypothetical protein